MKRERLLQIIGDYEVITTRSGTVVDKTVVLSLDTEVPASVFEKVRLATAATFIRPLYLAT